MSLHRRLLILLAFFYCGDALSQGGITWEQATPICNLTSASAFVPLPPVADYDLDDPANIRRLFPCSSSLYAFNLHNPAWYTIIATDTEVSMDITIAMCVDQGNGIGLQFGLAEIVDGIPEMVFCNTEGNTGTQNLRVNGLTIGNTYYLVLDGYALSVCQYSISNASGFENPQISGVIDDVSVNDISGSRSGCKLNGAFRLRAFDAAGGNLANATEYDWQITSNSGGAYNEPFLTIGPVLDIRDIPSDTYEVSVKPRNDCDNSQPSYTFSIEVQTNPIIELPSVSLCVEELSDSWMPTNPGYIGGELEGLPENLPTLDTFFVEIEDGTNCPSIQLLPIDFIGGSNIVVGQIDTTICMGDRVFINGDPFFARAAGSLPQYATLGGACSNTFEVFVTRFAILGEIINDECSSGVPILKFNTLINNFFDVQEFASYIWSDNDGNTLSTEPTYQVTTSGRYHLTIELQKGSNPSCSFDVGSISVDVSGIQELETTCGVSTSNSVSIQWNNIQDVDSYAIGVNGQVLAEDLTFTTANPMFVIDNGISEGEVVNIAVFAIGADPNCPPLIDTLSCTASNCAPIDMVISNVGIPDDVPISLCLSEDPTVLAAPLEFEVVRRPGGGTGRGRWVLSPRGTLPADDEGDRIIIDPNVQEPGEYVLSYRYRDGDCRYVSENVKDIEIIKKPISTELSRNGALDIDDGICINETLRLNYDGIPVYNGTAVWGGDISVADVMGNLEDGFEMTFATPGTKRFTFMLTTANGCNSQEASYTLEVGEPLTAQTIVCNSTAMGMEFDWPDQDCVEEYRIWVNGNRQTPDLLVSEYIYTQAANGNSYELEVRAISDCGCGEVDFISASCLHTFDACDEITVQISISSDTLVCLNNGVAAPKQLTETVTTATGMPAVGAGVWSVNTGNAAIDPSGIFDPTVAGAGTHVISYTWTEGTCDYADSLSVYVSEQITYGISFEDPTCIGESMGRIYVDPQGSSGDYSVLIDFVNQDSTLNEFPVDTGLHFLIILDNVTGCDTLVDININSGPDSLNLFRDTPYIILDGGSFTQTIDPAIAILADSLVWDYNSEIICDETSCGIDFSFEPSDSGILCFTGYFDGCDGYTECADIIYIREFKAYIPNVISLSADAVPINKVFEISTNDELAVITKMSIYDRWGNQVYENRSEGSVMRWDPKLNSQDCSQGVYAYYIEITKGDGDLEKRTGTLTVIK